MDLWHKKLFKDSCVLADILIANETEIRHIEKVIASPISVLVSSGLIVIETKGTHGSVIYNKEETIKIEPILVAKNKIVDPTGAGDAYRAGLISGLLMKKSLADACQFGAKIAAKSIQHKGGQEYSL